MAAIQQRRPYMEVSGNPSLPEVTIVKRPTKGPTKQDARKGEKLPSIRIPLAPVSKTKNQLEDFLDDRSGTFRGQPNAEAHFKVNILARDKAIQLLQQYNEIVSDNDSLAVKNVPPVKLSIRTFENKPVPRLDKNAKKAPVFTEGISSISKVPEPSFMVPKETVVRANLPNSVSVAQKKDKFSFGIKPLAKKSKDSDINTPRYKQMRILGLENLPHVEMGKFMSRHKLLQASVDYRSGVRGGYMKVPRKLDAIKLDERRTRKPANYSSDFAADEATLQEIKEMENKLHVVSIGDSFANKLREDPVRKGLPSLDDRFKPYSKDKRLLGASPVAQMRFEPQYESLQEYKIKPARSVRSRKITKKYSKSRAQSDLSPFPNDSIRIPIPNTEDSSSGNFANGNLRERSDSVPSYQQEVILRKMMNSPSDTASTITNITGLANPPPSYTSSNENQVDLEIVRNMTQIVEEQSNLEPERAAIADKTLPKIPSDMFRAERPPSFSTSNSVARCRLSDGRRSRNKELKADDQRRPPAVNSKKDGLHLSIPVVEMDAISERRPPMRDLRSELSDKTPARRYTDSQATWYSTDTEPQRLTVKNLQLFEQMLGTDHKQSDMPEVNVMAQHQAEAGIQGSPTDTENLIRQSTEDEFKKFTVSSKSLQFISPLKVIENAKRQ